MSNNIFKANFIQFSPENTKVIDANSLVAKRLEGFSGVYREADLYDSSQYDAENEDGLDPIALASLLSDVDEPTEPETMEETVESVAESIRIMKEEAEAEVEEIKRAAREDIENLRNEIVDSAREEGYQDGLKMAEEEMNRKLSELDEMKANMERDYELMVSEIEPKLVSVISDVYAKIFGNSLYDKKEVMSMLIRKALAATEGDSDIVIHISSADYDMVMEAKDVIFAKMQFAKEPVIRAEERLLTGQAKIENEFGILDCSIDTELEELTKALVLLSYEGHES